MCEARTCDVFTGSCFANADTGLTGKNAVLAWKVESGAVDGVKLDGLGVVAVLSTTDTLGLKQSSPGRSVLIVDDKATTAQRDGAGRVRQGPSRQTSRRSGRGPQRSFRPGHLQVRRRGLRHPEGRRR